VLRRLTILILPLLALGAPSLARAASGYLNPFSDAAYVVGRTDMGVDLCLAPGDPIAAIGDGVVAGIQPNWFENQPYIWYRLTSGPSAGRYVYLAEQITHLARVGQPLLAGETVAVYANHGTCIETGWATADGETLAQATTGYKEGQVTPAGVSFARFLIALGVRGNFQLTPSPTPSSVGKRKKRRPKPPRGPAPTPTVASHPPRSPVPVPGTPSGGASAAPASGGAGIL
jgi:hypothetical protein